jgi:surfactin synthase thioesterase subunit
VPYGGGSTIAYQPLARALPESIAVYAVRLPGHDVGVAEPLRPLADVAAEAAREILSTVRGRLALYGHCLGVALTVELARRLEDAGRDVDRVYLGGSFPFPTRRFLGVDLIRLVPFRRRRSDEQTMRYLRSLGGFEDVVEEDELRQVMTAFRHDSRAAGRWFTQRYAERSGVRLAAPVTFVVGGADPETSGYRRRYRRWERFSASVELAVVPGGGHYFVKHHAAELAGIIRRTWT